MVDLNGDMDAMHWVQEFAKVCPEGSARPDDGTMLAWFANATMAGFDTATNRAALFEGQGVGLIAAERRRQIQDLNYDAAHDHGQGEQLAMAAASYALPRGYRNLVPGAEFRGEAPDMWPWDDRVWKPAQDRVRELTKAGALIAAAIDAEVEARAVAPAPPLPIEPSDALLGAVEDLLGVAVKPEDFVISEGVEPDGVRTRRIVITVPS